MSLLDTLPGPNTASFDGAAYEPAIDDARLSGQLGKVYEAMRDGRWRTIKEIQAATGIRLDASVAKMLRNLRLERFGAFEVERRRRGEASGGVWEYRVGAKGSGHPSPAPELSYTALALRAADNLLPYLRHARDCFAINTLASDGLGQCTCGLEDRRALFDEARKRSRRG